jgi:hypothetical protein
MTAGMPGVRSSVSHVKRGDGTLKQRGHVVTDDTAICGNVSERPCRVTERDIAAIIGNRGGTKREPGQEQVRLPRLAPEMCLTNRLENDIFRLTS